MKPSLLPLLSILAVTLPAQQKPPQDNDEFFGLDKIWDVHLTVSERAWTLLFPEGGRSRGFGTKRFNYVGARIQIAGHKEQHIGLRFKGNSTYSSSVGTLKRSFKIDFDRYAKKQTFLGLKKLNLNNNTTDTTQIREAVSYQAYRDAGMPASRTAFARVFLTIKGRVKKEYLGLYTLIEQADRGMFERQLKDKVTILKPQGRLLAYYGEEWSPQYESTYRPKTKVSKKHQRLLMALSEIADADRQLSGSGREKTAEDRAALARSLERVMDVDGFLRYIAVTSILSNWDNPLNIAHNIYLIVPEKKDQIVWVPWDLNLSLSFGRFQGASAVNPRSRSLTLANSILAVENYKKAYRAHLSQLLDGACSGASLAKSITICRKTTKAALEQEATRSEAVTQAEYDLGGGQRRQLPTRFRTPADLIDVTKKREQWVRDELAGKVTAQPRTNSRFGTRNRNRARRVQLDSAKLMKGLLLVTGGMASDRTYDQEQAVAASIIAFKKLDTGASQSLDHQEMRAATNEFIKKQGRASPFSSGASTLSRALRFALDTDKNWQVSEAEWTKACKVYFASWDADKNGKLEAKELAVVVTR